MDNEFAGPLSENEDTPEAQTRNDDIGPRRKKVKLSKDVITKKGLEDHASDVIPPPAKSSRKKTMRV